MEFLVISTMNEHYVHKYCMKKKIGAQTIFNRVGKMIWWLPAHASFMAIIKSAVSRVLTMTNMSVLIYFSLFVTLCQK